ncbi:EndoU domain-containing protein [Salinimicrobium sp. TH3]|uniref:EndoU domain-containing protein n=1 Tax=Salinimicrobium sp. TH3 TaxID=2997342 RepID=UPI002275421F|nr:EndoU domain-containing protein [Salinimicrobium sp. TH3]MCY2687578.1 EndoU domain-containing protein [Salinimicrobium sp. TH3]
MDEKYFYYIIENVCKATGQEKLKVGIRIFMVPDFYPSIQEGEGPFKSLRNLKRNSFIYKKLILKGSKQVQKVLNNITVSEKFILTPEGKTYKDDFINVYLHVTKGRVKNGKVSGLHFFDPEKIKIIEEEYFDNATGVFRAKIEFFDKNTKRWIPKKASSTFFPKNWSPTNLFAECDFANMNKVKKVDSEHIYLSKTMSGIQVEIVVKNGKLTSIYPLV